MQQIDLFAQCQRWHRWRASYRPASEPFDPRRAAVEPTDEQAAKAFVVDEHHYSSSYPAARFRAGVFVKEPFQAAQLAGVGAYFPGLRPDEGIEIGRYVLADALAANAETWALARMRRLLREALPEVRGIVAYCDPVERRDAAGVLVKPGHIGTIYKASNAVARGRSSPRTLWLSPCGVSLPDRLLSKVRRGESGERYALARLAGLGAPRRQPHEAGAAYIARLKVEDWLRPVRHPGNLVFTFRLDAGRT